MPLPYEQLGLLKISLHSACYTRPPYTGCCQHLPTSMAYYTRSPHLHRESSRDFPRCHGYNYPASPHHDCRPHFQPNHAIWSHYKERPCFLITVASERRLRHPYTVSSKATFTYLQMRPLWMESVGARSLDHLLCLDKVSHSSSWNTPTWPSRLVEPLMRRAEMNMITGSQYA